MQTTIEILYFEGCPNYEPAVHRVREVLSELGLDAKIVSIEVDEETALRHQFPGSPTIRVNGDDVVPDESGSYGMSCRVYTTREGVANLPQRQAIRAALERRRA